MGTSEFLTKAIQDFFVAFGVVFGAAMLAGVSSVITMQPPATTMRVLAENVKIWAVVVAVGGSIDPIRVIEYNIQEGYLSPAFKQILFILFAFAGAYSGTELVKWLCRGG